MDIKEPRKNNENTENKIEKIGHVNLDLTCYSGEDKYCDGAVEDMLLEVARDRSDAEYQEIIEESASWPVLYHLSDLRENIVEWLPIDKSMKVLEVGAGCGAITGVLSRKAGSVTCCDLSLKRSRINAYRHQYNDNITIHVGNFTDVEKTLDRDFDYICLIGVFEYARGYVDSADPYGDFLKLIGSHLKPGGNIAIAIENRFGLKYWAGCREDHLGDFFSSIENYPADGIVRTFTDRKLIEIAKRSGFDEYHMYYPYPDYKFMTDLYSDRRLPHKGELKNNLRNFDRDRFLLFNEKDAYDSILDEELFNLYSNSYMMILGPEPSTEYARYSNDRARQYRLVTEMIQREGMRVIRKRALDEAARDHLKAMETSYKKLKRRYSGKGCKLNVVPSVLSEDGMTLEFEYVGGTSLEELLDDCLMRNDTDGFVELFKEYLERISYGEETADITDIDMIFSNILVEGNRWNVIDYEWTTNEVWKARDLGFRAIYCYILEDEKRDKLSLDIIMELLNINAQTAADLREQEMSFQKHVTADHKSLAEIRELIDNPVYRLEDGIERKNSEQTALNMRPQIYEDTGRGFNEEQSYFAEGFPFTMEVPAGRKALRIDPCSDFCIVSISEITWNGQKLPTGGFKFKTNGRRIGENTYAFATSDPGFTISLKGLEDRSINLLNVDMNVTVLDPETAGHIG
ncbi:Methyltransferase domain-containing protein [Lachnospiraceae bacterium XBB2008]|nr:Methyltransferase domain-containing protein [Lachnospiraceae bacterium XBB2008]